MIRCPVCQSSRVHPSICMQVPVYCNVLHDDVEQAAAAATASFELVFCGLCGHFYNRAFDASLLSYDQGYENSLHHSVKFEAYARQLAARLTTTYGLNGRTILDIGCGQGDFLKLLCAHGSNRGVGFDRAYQPDRGEPAEGVTFVRDWYRPDAEGVDPDFVVCRQVIEHLESPIDFLKQIAAQDGGVRYYFDVPNGLYTFRDLGIWDLIYEHASYFSERSFRTLLEHTGYSVLGCGTAFGDQVLYAESARDRIAPVPALPAPESIEVLMRYAEAFERAFRDKLGRWSERLSGTGPGTVAVWGAGSKGITFANIVDHRDRIACLVDQNPRKLGKYIAGAALPVVAPEALVELDPRYVVVMNPMYLDEIGRRLRALAVDAEVLLD